MQRRRRLFTAILTAAIILVGYFTTVTSTQPPTVTDTHTKNNDTKAVEGANTELAVSALDKLAIKGRAPRTGYEREQFGAGWAEVENCDMREYILQRDLKDVRFQGDNSCTVETGTLDDPYTAKTIHFQRGNGTSSAVQIDHVVALSNAWQTGAQQMDVSTRAEFANDPLELLAVDGPANQQKSDGDAATWLPPNKSYRCQYVARQIAVKQKYHLWLTQAEHDAMDKVLATCPTQVLPLVE